MPEEQVEQVENRIEILLRKILDLPDGSISSEAHIMEDLGADSWQYLEFRTELERIFRITIPDAEVDRLATVRESTGLVQEYIKQDMPESPAGRVETATSVAGDKRAWRSGYSYVGEDRAYYVDLELGIAHLGRLNFTETPMLKLIGELRWNHIGHFTKVPSKQLVDETGDRLYATFYYVDINFPRKTPMASFGENDRFTVVNTLQSYGNSIMDGYSFFYPASWPADKKVPLNSGKQAHDMGIPYVRSSNIFVKMLQGASWLKKSRPAQAGADNIPKIAEVPDSYPRIKKANEDGRLWSAPEHYSLLSPKPLSLEYQIVPDQDLNGVGLLYFANYSMILDIAERKLLSEQPIIPINHDLLDLRTVVSRENAYLSNAHQSDSIKVIINVWIENPFLTDNPAPEMSPIRLFLNYEMYRRSDGRKMVVSSAEKVIFGKTLEEAGMLEDLKRLAKDPVERSE